jgi:hypothetical protein
MTGGTVSTSATSRRCAALALAVCSSRCGFDTCLHRRPRREPISTRERVLDIRETGAWLPLPRDAKNVLGLFPEVLEIG